MTHPRTPANAASLLRNGRLWTASLAIALGGALIVPNFALRGDEIEAPKKAAARPSASTAEILFRGGDNAAVDRPFTLEILVVNSSASPLKDLEILGKLDDALEQRSKTIDFNDKVASIAANDLHIVRLPLTPRKSGPAGVDVTLRDKSGASQQIRFVVPVGSADAPRPEVAEGKSPLEFKFEPLKNFFVDRPGVVLVTVHNLDRKPMENKLDLVVNYGTMNRSVPIAFSGAIPAGPVEFSGRSLGRGSVVQGNPIRSISLSLPALESGESMTVPLRITPRRIGALAMSVVLKNNTLASGQLVVGFDPHTAIDQLLPTRTASLMPTKLPTSLTDVPEVSIEDFPAKGVPADEAFEQVAHLIEKINHVNKSKSDAYMEAMVKHRGDVRGLPFTLGDACRLTADRGQHFQAELARLRGAMGNPAAMAGQLPNPSQQEPESVVKARIAAMVQVLEPEGPQFVRQMVKYLASVSHIDATRVLARLAISSDDADVRNDAIAALTVRRDADFSEIFVNGLNYPLPAIAERAAEAIVKMKRVEMAAKLVDVLDRPDPRAPQLKEVDGKQVAVVREVVRVNHLKNCLLCHSPANLTPAAAANPPGGGVREDAVKDTPRRGMVVATTALVAPVPLPNQPVPSLSQGGYGQSSLADTLVAFDVTYLRQDFSVKLPVANAQPWPEMQRFDFLVRTRQVSEQDAQAFRDLVRPAAGELSPYARTAVAALRHLTGRDAEPNAAAWRQVVAQLKTDVKSAE